ncbi:MAG: CaiB/BaiF CoA-transferase family protein [Woeseiaceae bacterium]|nr:CaiB/BaiF CoA-transferase family protein [Woeseiaceae bacterium]
MTDAQANGPIAGIRVLDLSRVLAGPWASQLLADYGATVIKIEQPGSGDDTRHWGPPWLRDAKGNATGDSAYFLAANRNKYSVTVNLKHPDGQQIIRKLAAGSDVLLENFRVGTLRRLGLDFETLREINPRLVYCSITAYGQTGSRAQQPGYDAMMQASGGLMSITGPDEAQGGGPQKVGVAISDIMSGMYATSAILAALVARSASGEGQYIDLALYDCQVAWLANQNMNYLVGGMLPTRRGTAHPNIAPYQVFPTADGHLMLAVGNDAQFRACVSVLGCPELATDPKYQNNEARVDNRQSLVERLTQQFLLHDTAHWLRALSEAGVPAGPINTIADIFSEDYANERGLVRQLEHALAGAIPTVANPVRFSETPVEYRAAPPILGQHTREILQNDLQYSPEEIQALLADGAI